MPEAEIDTTNRFCVGAGDKSVHVLRPAGVRLMTPDDALVLAAWLVAIAEPMSDLRFEDCLRAVQET